MQAQIQRAAQLLQQEFGDGWRAIVQQLGTQELTQRLGRSLTSFMAFPARGMGGDNHWAGNCSPRVIHAVASYVLEHKRYHRKSVRDFTLIDPMSGSGTAQAVANALGIRAELYDLNPNPNCGTGGWDILTDEFRGSGDLVFLHPPYSSIIRYSGAVWGSKPHPDDLSRCHSYSDYIDKLNYAVKSCYLALRKDGWLAVLVGDIKENGMFHSIQSDMLKIGKFESFLVKAQFNCSSDSRSYHNSKPIIPIVTEYLLLMHKEDSLLIQITKPVHLSVSLLQRNDRSLTWHQLVRAVMESMGGKARLCDIADKLSGHPKAVRNSHYRDRIRAVVYEHSDQYINYGGGVYGLNYETA